MYLNIILNTDLTVFGIGVLTYGTEYKLKVTAIFNEWALVCVFFMRQVFPENPVKLM